MAKPLDLSECLSAFWGCILLPWCAKGVISRSRDDGEEDLVPTFFSGHQLSLSVGSPWCARLWCKSQVHFLPSTTLTRFSLCFNRGCFSCRKKTTKIWRFRAKQGKNPQHFLPAAPSPVPVLPRSCRVRLRSPSSQAGPRRSLEESVISSFS